MNTKQAELLLRELVAVPSVNPACLNDDGSLTGESRMADYLIRWGENNGIPCARYPTSVPERSSVVFTIGSNAPDAPVLFCCAHMDTVWSAGMERPFELKEKDSALWGLGAADDKGPMCALLLMLVRLKDTPLNCRLQVACTVDEEADFLGIKDLIPGRIKPDAVIVCEGTSLDVIVAHKGDLRFTVVTRGESVHSSLVPKGRSAIYPAARLLLAAEQYASELYLREKHPLLGTPTSSVGIIHGGTQGNSVPDYCEFVVDRRMLPGETPESVRADLIRALDSAGVAYELHGPTLYSAPFELPHGSGWADQVSASVREFVPRSSQCGVLYATEASRTGEFGIPSVVFGPGSIQTAHSPQEHIDPREIMLAVECLSAVVVNFRREATR